MELPEEIKIGNCKYQVTSVKKLLFGNTAYEGIISYKNSEIVILDSLVPQEKVHVLWHEVVHGMFGEHNIPIPDIKYEEHETIVDLIAKAIRQVVKDNPELIKITIK